MISVWHMLNATVTVIVTAGTWGKAYTVRHFFSNVSNKGGKSSYITCALLYILNFLSVSHPQPSGNFRLHTFGVRHRYMYFEKADAFFHPIPQLNILPECQI